MSMNKYFNTTLSVPADLRFLMMIQGYVRELAAAAGLPSRDITGVELAAEEATVNIIEHAYPDGRPGKIFLEGEIGPTELVLSIRDEGLPYDPSLDGGADPEKAAGEFSAHGLGLCIIRHQVDEAHFENLGRRGKVLRLVKHLPAPAQPDAEQLKPQVEQAPPQHYEIRPMRPEEAIQVARIFWLTYGYSYRNDNFYRPEGIIRLVGSGKVVSIVAVTESGEVVGHIGLMRPEPLPMGEVGLLVINPAHRGRGLMESLIVTFTSKVMEMNLLGVSMNIVTSHAISQRKGILKGGKSCSVILAASPPRLFKSLAAEESLPQRESYLHAFFYCSAPPPVTAHVPSRHREMIARIYENLSQKCTPGDPAPAVSQGEYRIDFNKALLKGIIRVITADERQWSEIFRAAEDLSEYAGAEVVYLDLPLAQPASALLCELAEQAEFFFSGVMPREARDGDILRLQRLNIPFDTTRLNLFDEFSITLYDYVKACMGQALRGKGNETDKS
jgi:anti-sigma regulatory factor (Ser/Thr protein kinase)